MEYLGDPTYNVCGWWAREERKNKLLIRMKWESKQKRDLINIKIKNFLKIELLIMWLIVKLLIAKWERIKKPPELI